MLVHMCTGMHVHTHWPLCRQVILWAIDPLLLLRCSSIHSVYLGIQGLLTRLWLYFDFRKSLSPYIFMFNKLTLVSKLLFPLL